MASLVDTTTFEKYESGDAQTFLDGVSEVVRSYCGWHIAPEVEETVTLDGRGGSHLWLPTKHIVSVSEVKINGTATTDYAWSEDGYLALTKGCLPNLPRSVEVTMNHGYAEVPADVAQVVMQVAARAKSSPAGALREQAGQVSVDHGRINGGITPGAGLLAHELDALQKYKLPTRVW